MKLRKVKIGYILACVVLGFITIIGSSCGGGGGSGGNGDSQTPSDSNSVYHGQFNITVGTVESDCTEEIIITVGSNYDRRSELHYVYIKPNEAGSQFSGTNENGVKYTASAGISDDSLVVTVQGVGNDLFEIYTITYSNNYNDVTFGGMFIDSTFSLCFADGAEILNGTGNRI